MTSWQEILLWHLTRHKIYIFPREKWTLSLQIWNSGALGNILSAINLQLSLLIANHMSFKKLKLSWNYLSKLFKNQIIFIVLLGVLIIFIMECRLGFRFWEFHSLWLYWTTQQQRTAQDWMFKVALNIKSDIKKVILYLFIYKALIWLTHR